MSDVEHLFMCLLAICKSSLEKCLFRYFSHFLFVYLLLSCMNCLYTLEINFCELLHLLLFSPILGVFFLKYSFFLGISLVFSSMSFLYILEINSLSVVSFVAIFSYAEGCLFTLLIVSFIVQKLLLFGPICLFLLLFPLLWEVGHRGFCCDLCRRAFYLCFPLGVLSFLVLDLDL